jgi:hypothetical protein
MSMKLNSGRKAIQMKMAVMAICAVAFAMSAAAQDVTGTGTTNTVPVFTGASTVGNSPIAVSGGSVGIGTTTPGGLLDVEGSFVHSGLISTTGAAAPGTASYSSSYGGSYSAYAWDLINAQVTNPSTSVNDQYYGYLSVPAVTASDGTSRYVIGGDFTPSLVASGASTANHLYGVVGSAFLGSPSTTAGYTSLNGGSFAAGIAPTVPAATIVSSVNVATLSPLVQSGAVTAVRGVWVTPSFGSTSGPASLVIPNYYGLELGAPTYANGAAITNNYGISQEDSVAKNYFAGKVGIGTTAPGYSLDVAGTIRTTSGGVIFPDGSMQATAFIPANCGADYAEAIDVTGDRTKYEPGDILVIDPSAPGKFLKSNQAYSTMVAGIYSTKPGFVGRKQPSTSESSATEVPMAMVGRVPTKVSAENGPIKVGDLLVSSSTVGYAMKGTDRGQMLGAIVGKALGSLDSGIGVIEVLVTLQ